MTTVKFKKLHSAARLPEYAHGSEDAGMDLFFLGHRYQHPDGRSEELLMVSLGPGERRLFDTGLAIELPPGFEGQVRPRSGLALKQGVMVLNAPGTIDPGYRGPIGVILFNSAPWSVFINPGDRIAQLVIAPVVHAQIEEVDEMSTSDRGTAGFGSTGK